MATLYLSKRDQRRAQKLRASTVPSEVSELEDYVAEDETHVDVKKARTRVQVQASESESGTDATEIPMPALTSEPRCLSPAT